MGSEATKSSLQMMLLSAKEPPDVVIENSGGATGHLLTTQTLTPGGCICSSGRWRAFRKKHLEHSLTLATDAACVSRISVVPSFRRAGTALRALWPLLGRRNCYHLHFSVKLPTPELGHEAGKEQAVPTTADLPLGAAGWVYEFPVAAGTNDHMFSGLKQYRCIILQFGRSEV